MKYLQFSCFILIFLISASSNAQTEITLEGIWKDGLFQPNYVPGFNFMNDGKSFTRLKDNKIQQYDITTGENSGTILDGASIKETAGFGDKISGYSFNHDESMIIIESEKESIYRRSYRAKYHIYDRASQKLIPTYEEGKVQYCTLSPDGTKAAYVFENDLYFLDLKSGETLPITDDGLNNSIINGAADWVYEEEFSFAKAFFWSPDSKKIAYIKFDETDVMEFTMTNYRDGLYPDYETFKYPKVGERNAIVSVHIHDITSDKTTTVDIGQETDMYIPRLKWTKDADQLCVFRMNRHQNHLELLLADAQDGETKLLMEETSKYYIDIHDNMSFLEDGKHFVWTSEKSGYNHVYLYSMKGKEKASLTSGNFDVTEFYGLDEKNERIYYQAAEKNPLERQIYSVDLKGRDKKLLTDNQGTNRAQFSDTYDYFVNNYSNANQASSYTVLDRTGREVRSIEDNAAINKIMKDVKVQEVEFFDFATSEGVTLNGWMIKPANFKADRKYPVFMYVYGGPGSQTVNDSYLGSNYWWFQKLAQDGYLVVSVDNRGTGSRGEEFKKMTYLKLGDYETKDQIEAAKYLGNLPYTDADRIGIFGWSYGGYMSSLCITKGADVFKAAIAVAPVTSWKWYDTIYTERYMRTLEENEAGYKDNSPVYFADLMKGNYLLVHGVSDDNVHFQHAAEMANALIKANKQFDTYFYPNRNHGIYGNNARLHLYTKMTEFIHEKL